MPAEDNTIYQFHDNCEKKVYINWINRNLFIHEDLGPHLPINPNSDELFDAINDGIIFCAIIKNLFPYSIDSTVIITKTEMTREEKYKNLQLAYETARSYGCNVVELNIDHIFSGVRQSVLEFLWQIFLVGLVQSITYLENPEILLLKSDDEPKDVIKRMKPEETLTRYINYMISKYNPSGPNVSSFQQNLNDGCMYMYLFDSIAKHSDIFMKNDISSISQEPDPKDRIYLLLENLDCMKVQAFLVENLMDSGCLDQACYKMHLLTAAVLFHKFPLVSENEKSQISQINDEIKLEQESHIEKLCRNFINFLGVNPICTNIHHDCKDGLLIAQIMDILSRDIFYKDTFIKDFSKEQIVSERIHNGANCINRLDKFISVPINDLYPEYIQAGNRALISDIIYNLMLYWVYYEKNTSKKYNKKQLLEWVNSFSNDYEITSFRDTLINDKRVLAKVIDKIFPNSVDWDYIETLSTSRDRALYCISIARREGCPMFVSPFMLGIGDHRCVTLTFALLQNKSPHDSKECPS